ncbi:hypothetical protein Holit_03177 [Hollandina sp. SP2]
MTGCFLCGDDRADISSYWEENDEEGAVRLVKCPNCGDYKISIPAEAEIINGIHQKQVFPIIFGEVFDSFYYKNEIKVVKTDDFRTAKSVSTIEKLYRLAKYLYTESGKAGNEGLPQKPACCFCLPTDENYGGLMKCLEKHGIIRFIDTATDDEDITEHFSDIRVTVKARIAFERGINTVEDFERVFMSDKGSGDTYNLGPNSQLNQASGHAVLTATQNNGPNMAELQPLIDCLLAAVPP